MLKHLFFLYHQKPLIGIKGRIQIRIYEENGETIYITEINSSNYALREFAKRTSMNAPIQGSAADIIKIAMIKVHNKMKDLNLTSKIVAQVHDELIIDAKVDEVEIIKSLLKETMEHAVVLDVKMEVDVETGKTWDLK